MADFAQWISAAEPKLPWENGKFMEICNENQNDAMSAILESDGFSMALKKFIEGADFWEGTATELKVQLEQYNQDDELIKVKYWPKTPSQVARKLNLIAPSLRAVGIETEYMSKGKIWKFCRK